jgi:hypothetical protein
MTGEMLVDEVLFGEPVALQAVCFKCCYRTDKNESTCPECSFPLIMQREDSPPRGIGFQEILSRASLRKGAPRLPGIDSRPVRLPLRARTTTETRKPAESSEAAEAAEAAPSRPRSRQMLHFTLVCTSAVLAGVLAAMLHGSL